MIKKIDVNLPLSDGDVWVATYYSVYILRFLCFSEICNNDISERNLCIACKKGYQTEYFTWHCIGALMLIVLLASWLHDGGWSLNVYVKVSLEMLEKNEVINGRQLFYNLVKLTGKCLLSISKRVITFPKPVISRSVL